MDLLKDLPCRDKQNFSRYTQGMQSHSGTKTYIRLKGSGPQENPQVIVTDSESVLHKELLALVKRKSLKRSSSSRQETTNGRTKMPRTDSDTDDSLDTS